MLRAEHDRVAGRLLQERREHATVGVRETLGAQLLERLTKTQAVEDLPKYELVERKQQHNARARCQIAARELISRVEPVMMMCVMVTMIVR